MFDKKEELPKFCPMCQPLAMQVPSPVQGTAPKIQLNFIPCNKEKCQLWGDNDCRLAFIPKK